MVNFKYLEQEVLLEDFHLEGPAIVSGLFKDEAHSFSNRVILELERNEMDGLSYQGLVRFSADFLGEGARKNYLILGNYLDSIYKRDISDPFFIFIGGAASTGKDLLVSDLQYYLGVDRVTPTDLLRDTLRDSLSKEYGGESNVPEEFKDLFKALFQVSDKGIELQVNLIRQQAETYFVNRALKECKTWVHPFHVLHGTHAMPGMEDCVEGDNKLAVVINPTEDALRSRIYLRQERERGPILREEQRIQRREECENTLRMRRYIQNLAEENGGEIISSNSRIDVLHEFGDRLIGKLEGIVG